MSKPDWIEFKQYDEQLKVLSTPEEGEALRTRLQQEFDEAVRPYARPAIS